MTRFRRLAKDFERLPKTVAASFRGVRVHHAGAVLCDECMTRSSFAIPRDRALCPRVSEEFFSKMGSTPVRRCWGAPVAV
jgi:hypothetical protein